MDNLPSPHPTFPRASMLTDIFYSLSLERMCWSLPTKPIPRATDGEQSIVPDRAEKAGRPPKNHQGNWLRVQIPGLWHQSLWSSGAEVAREPECSKGFLGDGGDTGTRTTAGPWLVPAPASADWPAWR